MTDVCRMMKKWHMTVAINTLCWSLQHRAGEQPSGDSSHAATESPRQRAGALWDHLVSIPYLSPPPLMRNRPLISPHRIFWVPVVSFTHYLFLCGCCIHHLLWVPLSDCPSPVICFTHRHLWVSVLWLLDHHFILVQCFAGPFHHIFRTRDTAFTPNMFFFILFHWQDLNFWWSVLSLLKVKSSSSCLLSFLMFYAFYFYFSYYIYNVF